MGAIEQLQKAIAASSAHQERLQAIKNEDDAISVLLDIANAESIALERADLERLISSVREKASELSDDELAVVSGGWRPPRDGSWLDRMYEAREQERRDRNRHWRPGLS
jgi:bacteriocin-like protein